MAPKPQGPRSGLRTTVETHNLDLDFFKTGSDPKIPHGDAKMYKAKTHKIDPHSEVLQRGIE